jgi:uncharacterized protein (DUF305 family)
MRLIKTLSLLFFTTFSIVLAQDTTQTTPGQTMSVMPMGMSIDMLSGLEGEAFEQAFLTMMRQHHQMAIDMSNWILERSEDEDIRGAAQKVIDEQQAEIEQIDAWLQEWYSGTSEMTTDMQGMMDTMESDIGMMMQNMEASDNPDRAFLENMSMHHDSAIDMAQPALFKALHPEVRELAKTIITSQAEEIAQYQTWLAGMEQTPQN